MDSVETKLRPEADWARSLPYWTWILLLRCLIDVCPVDRSDGGRLPHLVVFSEKSRFF
jgi:hypothetical protein